MRLLAILLLPLLFPGSARADDALDPDGSASSPRAKRIRGEALEKWKAAGPAWELAKAGKPVPGGDAREAVGLIEEAVELYERSLALEWDGDANRQLAEAIRAYFKLRKHVPEEKPQGEEERKKAEKAADRAHKERVREARRFVLDYGRARRYSSLFDRCPQCGGRKEISSAFGDKRMCPTCKGAGLLVDREGIVEARWSFFSPLYRADLRNEREVTRAYRIGQHRPEQLAPFVKSVRIRGDVEDHGTWVRITTREKTHTDARGRRTDKVETTYVIYRVGKQWYLYHPRYDRELIDVPEPEEKD